ncbi:hypothetical protein ADL15_36855 [Actinoplanes awajinensis subsp. mycoplanecinus]|uniref:C4-dicarboxylate ABC transporter n=1 Tax=Actinoplanes awajinensis subsp. mycoplanecinus TaxID=135947 RepID=A0A101JHJ1_9ACTN|nr:hypothetical protein ADL15_36855 [Actinoplanes awajinensis subsp. mycoplanecinus]
MSALILAAALLDASRPLSAGLWWAGSVAQLALTLHVLRTLIADPRFEPGHVHPAWCIPIVDNLVVPLAGTTHAPAEVPWYFFAVGLGYWLTLLPIILNRLLLHGPLPPQLTPTLAILIAPPAVAYLSWLHLGAAATDPAARILLHLATFQALLSTVQTGRLRKLPFTLSAWAYTFPLAALTAAFLAAAQSGLSGYRPAAALTLGMVSLLTAGLTARTLLAVRCGELSRPEPAATGIRGLDVRNSADLRP